MSAPMAELLNADYLRAQLADTTVVTFDTIDSTNAYLLREHAAHNTLCTAEAQTAGRGRRGRVWHSPYAQNLYFSLRWDFTDRAEELPQVGLVTALCIAQTLHAHGVADVGVKWPNDIYLGDRKLGGILVESQHFSRARQALVVGVGLNVAMAHAQEEEITQPWASLAQCDIGLSRNALLVELVRALKCGFAQFQRHGGQALLADFARFDRVLNRKVRLNFEHSFIDGVYQGIDCATGEALIATDHRVQRFRIGEISLRLHEE
ncbi:biotin--[acetyl-CoA-carboxylase] ligase [Pasteurellaceae bacterium 20609_3]|uniref:biotin--[acetyl-CoA-carboxylase] ligase n=1 Tax=Spirabiliibacterium mucosae TaxID=28156 RepID=UPI001AACFE0B|nr:biotin--[acetyl-CoA-carboxylase] ligase [Spirabiliibacterium mucosae]MBE2898529.1 biotin--[acetyl-CoA-carboxylase] ligase [Spirabiliibacterium mucosae]